jgi:hypothetical protein
VLKIDINKIMDLFEKHISQNLEPLVAITCSGILSEQMNIDNALSQSIYQRMTSQATFTLL